MRNVIIGNVIAFIAAVLMLISGYVKSKKVTLLIQTVEVFLDAVACFVLGAVSGGIVNLFSLVRNILAYLDKFTPVSKAIIILSVSVLSIKFNSNGWVGYLPILSTIIYIVFVDKTDKEKFKILSILTMGLWVVHDFMIQAYVSVLFDLGTIITSSIAIYRIGKDKQKGAYYEEEQGTPVSVVYGNSNGCRDLPDSEEERTGETKRR